MVRGRPVNPSVRYAALVAADQGEAQFTYVGQTVASIVVSAFAPTEIAGACSSAGNIETQDVAVAESEFIYDCLSQGAIDATATASSYSYSQIDGRTGATWAIKTGQYGLVAVTLGNARSRGKIRTAGAIGLFQPAYVIR